MCIQTSGVRFEAVDWDGLSIIQDCIVPSSRPVPYQEKLGNYDIDVREFLISERNAVIGRTLGEDIPRFISSLGNGSLAQFTGRGPGCYDFRAHIVCAFVAETIAYKLNRRRNAWQFPDETLTLKFGDCEDRAFLIASLLLGSGISGYNYRVVLGKVRVEQAGRKTTEHDHMWVMYKNEIGGWRLIEPLLGTAQAEESAASAMIAPGDTTVTYEPYFLFNDRHLWRVPKPQVAHSLSEHLNLAGQWSKLKPSFAGAAHKTIVSDALSRGPNGQPASAAVLAIRNTLTSSTYFKGAVFGFGPIVARIDRNTGAYDPRDHFDNAYIDESWGYVNQRLDAFKHDHTNFDSFDAAAHGIADFYAHTSFVHFASKVPQYLSKFDGKDCVTPYHSPLQLAPNYGAGQDFELTLGKKFSVNAKYASQHSNQPIPALWAGKLISGRYAQDGDTQPGLINQLFEEGPSHIPPGLLNAPDFWHRWSLPHHNEIAVDSDSGSNKLYNSSEYARQFLLRSSTASRHIREAFYSVYP